MKLVGLTGGIASGKSSVTKLLRKKGYPVIDLDQVARDVVVSGSPGLHLLIDHFGSEYLKPDGTLNRKKLGDLVFQDADKLEQLDALMGPLMWAEVEKQRDSFQGDLGFLDAALLIEKNMHEHVDWVLLVTAPEDLRIRRAMQRDGATQEQVRARIRAQMSDKTKRAVADFEIENTGTLINLHRQLEEVLKVIHESF